MPGVEPSKPATAPLDRYPHAPVAAAATTGAVGADPIVSARGLVKRFGTVEAVKAIDVDAYPQDFLGFLGPNGAGKTTLMKMIYCLVEPTAGTLHVFGREVRADARGIKSRLGVVAQENNLDPDLTVWQNLMIYARYFGLRPVRRERQGAGAAALHAAGRQEGRGDHPPLGGHETASW